MNFYFFLKIWWIKTPWDNKNLHMPKNDQKRKKFENHNISNYYSRNYVLHLIFGWRIQIWSYYLKLLLQKRDCETACTFITENGWKIWLTDIQWKFLDYLIIGIESYFWSMKKVFLDHHTKDIEISFKNDSFQKLYFYIVG